MKLTDVKELKKILIEYGEEKSPVSRESFIRAKTNISTMMINNTEDAFLFYSSLNLLNSYIKQNKKQASYGFKEDAVSGFDSIITNNIDGVTYNYDKNEKVLMIEIAGLQFSFHHVLPSAKMDFVKNFKHLCEKNYLSKNEWEGLKLQPQAEAIFKFASSLDGLSLQSIAGNLKEIQDEQVKYDLLAKEKEAE